MERSKSSFIVVLVIFFIMAFAFIGLFINRMAGESQRIEHDTEVSEAIAKAADYNFHIYWIGECPSELMAIGDKITVLDSSKVNEDNMPIVWTDIPYKVYNSDGTVLMEVEPRDYADHMLIVIRSGVNLTREQYEIIRNCVVENDVSMLILGDSINGFREVMLQSPSIYSDNDNVLYSILDETKNVIDPSSVSEGGLFTKEVLNLMYTICDKQEQEWYIAANGTSSESEDNNVTNVTEYGDTANIDNTVLAGE